MDIKSFKIDIDAKSLDEQGSFKGIASVYGNKDLQGDVVDPGAFTRTLKSKGNSIPLLWNHDPNFPIGIGTVEDGKKGLNIEGQLNLDTQKGKETYSLLKQGVLQGLSIGYNVIKDEYVKSTRHLKELKLWEVSVVTFPANPKAGVNKVKSNTNEDMKVEGKNNIENLDNLIANIGKDEKNIDFNSALKMEQIRDSRWKMESAFWKSVNSIMENDDMTDEDKTAALGTTLDQFKAAFLSWADIALKIDGQKDFSFNIEGELKEIKSLLSSKSNDDSTEEGDSHSDIGLDDMMNEMKSYYNK